MENNIATSELPVEVETAKPKKTKKAASKGGAKKVRNYGVNDILNWNFKDIALPQDWADHLGDISDGFRMIVHGKSGHGKTEYIAKLCKMFAMNYGKVNLNQVEQGKSKTFKTAAQRNNYAEMMQDTKTRGKFTMADPSQRIFDVWFDRLCTRNSGRVIVLDSLDYMKLTVEQFKKMHEKFKLKGIVVVCWDDPWDPNAKRIKYMCDIKVKVHNFRAKIISRYGGNKTFVIWDNPHDVNYDSKQQEKIDDKYKSEYVEEEEETIINEFLKSTVEPGHNFADAIINKEADKVKQ